MMSLRDLTMRHWDLATLKITLCEEANLQQTSNNCWFRILLKSDIVCWSYDNVYRGLLFPRTHLLSKFSVCLAHVVYRIIMFLKIQSFVQAYCLRDILPLDTTYYHDLCERDHICFTSHYKLYELPHKSLFVESVDPPLQSLGVQSRGTPGVRWDTYGIHFSLVYKCCYS